MSMPDKMRNYLTDWPDEERKVPELARDHPQCACEAASSPLGSSGIVQDVETLRYFVNSRSDVDLKKKKKFGPRSMARMFTTGLSVCRIDAATPDEIYLTAELLFASAQERAGEYGGIVGVLDFRCGTIRNLIDEGGRRLACVLETPLDPTPDGRFERPSHADVVCANETCNDQQALRVIVYNAIKAAEGEGYTPLDEVEAPQLVEFLPLVLRSA